MIARCLIFLILLLLLSDRAGAKTAQTPSAGAISVPFRFTHGEVVAQATINGQGPFNVLLDTGADPSVINLATARQLGLKIDSTGGQGSGTGTDVNLAYGTTIPAVELGDLRAANMEAVAMDLSKISKKIGQPITAVLDYTLLKGRIVQFDFPGRVVRFLSSAPYPNDDQTTNTAKVTTISFKYKDDILADGVVVNGKKMLAHVDTGCNSAFQLTAAGVIEAGLQNVPTISRQSVGFNGVAKSRQGKIGMVTIGGISVRNPTATFFNKGTGYDHEGWGIRIGNEFMQHYIVTFDFQSMKISFAQP